MLVVVLMVVLMLVLMVVLMVTERYNVAELRLPWWWCWW